MAKKLELEIGTCWNCPYFSKACGSPVKMVCWNSHRYVESHWGLIPEWCPL